MENLNFKNQYPLSPKKFWKKMYGVIFGGFFFALFLALLPGIYKFMTAVAGNADIATSAALKASLPTFLAVFFIFFILRTLVYAWYWKVYIARYYYSADESFLTIRKGVFTPSEIHVQYGKIQDVYVDQDLIDRIMGLYDVHIASATMSSSIEAHIDGVEKDVADALKNLLLGKIKDSAYNPSQNPTAQAAIPASTGPEHISLSKPVSRETFPMNTGAWYTQKIISLFGTNLIILILLFLQFEKNDLTSSGSGNFLGIFVGIFVLLFVIRLIGLMLWNKNYYFNFLPEYIVMRTGILNRQENHVPYRTVQDIRIQQSFIERILGIANVIVENAAAGGGSLQNMRAFGSNSSVVLVAQPLAQAQEVSEILKKTLLNHKSGANTITGM